MTDKTLQVLRDTIPAEEKSFQGTGVDPNTAWLADLYGYWPWNKASDPALSIDEALKLSGVLIALDVLAQDIAKTPLWLRRRLPNGGSTIVEPKEHWLARLLALEPNRYHTWYEFLEMIVLHLAAVQNAFIAKKYTNRTQVAELVPVLPGRVRVLIDETTSEYVYNVLISTPNERLQLQGFDAYLLEDEMIHIRGRMFDGLFGYSNLEAGSSVMAFAKALQGYQTKLYKNDATIAGIFQMKGDKESLSDEAFKRLKEQLRESWSNARTGNGALILEDGLEFKSVAMNADQAEVVKNRDKAIEDIARLFRIPPHKLMHIVNVKYENMDTLEKSYVQDTLEPICRRVEDKLSRALLSEDERVEYSLKFDREAMQLSDIVKQSEAMKVLADRGAMTINEMRQRRNMNPLPDAVGNVRLFPQNFNVVDADNNVLIEAGQPTSQSANPDQTGDNAKTVEFPKLRAVE